MKTLFAHLTKFILGIALLGTLVFGFARATLAAPSGTPYITVNTTADNTTADSKMTLREALLIARDGTNPGGLNRPLTDAEVYQLVGCQITGYEPDHWWITSGCGSNVAEGIYFYMQNCPCTIAPTTPLPEVPSFTTIDGYSGQPGAAVNTSKTGMNAKIMIRLSGWNESVNTAGLTPGYQVTIKGLEIYGFPGTGIFSSSGKLTLTGSVIDGNAANGLAIYGNNNHVGGVNPADRNSFYENAWHGIEVKNGANANQIVNNLIGVPPDSDKGAGNFYSGVSVYSSNNYINSNIIAYNGDNGILINSGVQNNFYNNSFHDNGKLGIDLGNNGWTPNDASPDGDTGANNLQNYPSLSKAAAATHTVTGKLTSKPNTTYQIDLYKSAFCDANGYGEGATRIGTITVTTDASGVAKFTAVTGKFGLGKPITAVASGPDGTSEFSKCKTAS